MHAQWQEICLNLQKTLNPGTYQVWIKPLCASEENTENLDLFAPSAFVADWVRRKLVPEIDRAAEQVYGHRVTINVSARPPEKNLEAAKPSALPASQPEQKEQLSFAIPMPRRKIPPACRFAFENFVVGPTNNMAYAAAQNMVHSDAVVTMLFLSSSSGLGKTHLSRAVAHALCSSSARTNVHIEYLTAEDFAAAFVHALHTHTLDEFKNRFRNSDLLLLEDVHFLQGKEKMQDEVLSTIKTLQSKGSRVVLTSSFAPCELKNVDSQLVSRFCSGFLANIDRPDADTRRRILQEKAREQNILLPEPVLDLLTEELTADIRQMESCMHMLALKARLLNQNLSLEMANEILAQYAHENPCLSIDSIIRRVSAGFNISPENLKSKSRRQDLVTARNMIFYLARRHTNLSLEEIGMHCNRQHSTVLKGIAAVERELNRETSLGHQIASMIALLEKKQS